MIAVTSDGRGGLIAECGRCGWVASSERESAALVEAIEAHVSVGCLLFGPLLSGLVEPRRVES